MSFVLNTLPKLFPRYLSIRYFSTFENLAHASCVTRNRSILGIYIIYKRGEARCLRLLWTRSAQFEDRAPTWKKKPREGFGGRCSVKFRGAWDSRVSWLGGRAGVIEAAISKRCARGGEVSRRSAARRQRCYSPRPYRCVPPLAFLRTRLSHTIIGDHGLRNPVQKPKGRRYWHLSALWH